MSAIRTPWSHDETLLAVNLYCRIPFGRQHSRAPEVIELATAIGRTPSSVAMKLNNLTSLDPEERARGVKGLAGASKLDRDVWDRLHSHWEEVATESELLWIQLVKKRVVQFSPTEGQGKEVDPGEHEIQSDVSIAKTEAMRTTKVRLAQGFFRRAVLAAYLDRCCISGLAIPDLLIASHILPWADHPEQRVNPCNGLCLSRLHDAAFDKGLITFDERYRLVLSKRIKDFMGNESVHLNFVAHEGKQLFFPEKFFPNRDFLRHHRENIYCSA